MNPHVTVFKGLLPFEGKPKIDPHAATWTAEPMNPFRPRGLMLWHYPAGASVELLMIGCVPQLVACVGDIPAEWFGSFDSYEAVWRAHQEGKEPPGWGDFEIIAVGMRFQVRISARRGGDLVAVPAEDWHRVRLLCWGDVLR